MRGIIYGIWIIGRKVVFGSDYNLNYYAYNGFSEVITDWSE